MSNYEYYFSSPATASNFLATTAEFGTGCPLDSNKDGRCDGVCKDHWERWLMQEMCEDEKLELAK